MGEQVFSNDYDPTDFFTTDELRERLGDVQTILDIELEYHTPTQRDMVARFMREMFEGLNERDAENEQLAQLTDEPIESTDHWMAPWLRAKMRLTQKRDESRPPDEDIEVRQRAAVKFHDELVQASDLVIQVMRSRILPEVRERKDQRDQ